MFFKDRKSQTLKQIIPLQPDGLKTSRALMTEESQESRNLYELYCYIAFLQESFRSSVCANFKISEISYYRRTSLNRDARFKLDTAEYEHLRRYIGFFIVSIKRELEKYGVELPVKALHVGIEFYEPSSSEDQILNDFHFLLGHIKKRFRQVIAARSKWNKYKLINIKRRPSLRINFQLSNSQYNEIISELHQILTKKLFRLIRKYLVPLEIPQTNI